MTDENPPILQLESFGKGLRHMCMFRPGEKPCTRCDAKGYVGHHTLPLICPVCKGEKHVVIG